MLLKQLFLFENLENHAITYSNMPFQINELQLSNFYFEDPRFLFEIHFK
jgi:hypothetical protein